MPDKLSWTVSVPQPTPEVLIIYEMTREFHQEVKYREDFERYCQWYRSVAQMHQQEFQRIQGDINLFRFFSRR